MAFYRNIRFWQGLLLIVPITLLAAYPAWSQTKAKPDGESLKLAQSVMCEGVENSAPHNSAVIFPITLGRVFCFTAFDPVPESIYIFHSWFRKDDLITTRRLILNPPRWSTYTRIQLRQADKGPWRVEIHDQWGNLLKTLRFSITD